MNYRYFFACAGALVSIATLAACGGGSVGQPQATPNPTPTPTVAPIPSQSPYTSTAVQVVPNVSPAASGQPAATPAPVPLPTGGGVTPVLELPASEYAGDEQITAVLQNTAPSSIPALNLKRAPAAVRHVLSTDSEVSILFLELFWGSPDTLVSQPGFTFTLPQADIVSGVGYYLAFYDPTRPSLGWQYDYEGPASVSGTKLTFTGGSSAFTIQADVAYWYTLIAVPTSATQPTPAPSTAPSTAPTASPPPATNPGASMTMTFDDEFNGTPGPVDNTKWTSNVGPANVNGELEYDANVTNPSGANYAPQYALVNGSGDLVITESPGNPYNATCSVQACQYVSARLNTSKTFNSQVYGYYEIRAQVPSAVGSSSAFWLEGLTSENVDGEIDSMESIGSAPNTVFGAIHGPGFDGEGGPLTFSYTPGPNLTQGFHVYGMLWQPNSVTYYIDNVAYATVTPSTIPAGGTWIFTNPLYVVLDVSAGGVFAGSTSTFTTPTTMVVDYVHVYH